MLHQNSFLNFLISSSFGKPGRCFYILALFYLPVFAQKSTTVKSGRWSQSATWGGKLPKPGDTVIINHALTVDISATTGPLTINKDGWLRNKKTDVSRITVYYVNAG